MTPGGKITPHLSFRNTCEEFVCDKMDKKKKVFAQTLHSFLPFNSSNVYSDSSSFIISRRMTHLRTANTHNTLTFICLRSRKMKITCFLQNRQLFNLWFKIGAKKSPL